MDLKKLLEFDRFLMALAIAIIASFFLITLLFPIVFDSDHFSDTIFILGSAWRSYNGLIPAVDFGHFYGGAVSAVISLAFNIFGVSVKAIDYAQVLIFVFFGIFIAYLRYIKLSNITIIVLFLLTATLVFTRFPLEIGQSITGVHSTHSFFYNRFGLATIVILLVVCSFKADEKKIEYLAGFLISLLLVFVSFLKFSFIVMVPAVILALIVQGRFIALVTALLGSVLILLIMGSIVNAFIESYNYIMLALANRTETSVLFVIQKTVQIIAAHPLALIVCLAVVIMLRTNLSIIWKNLLAVVLIVGAGFAASATMGHGGNLGQMAIPLFAACILVGYEYSAKYSNENKNIIKVLLACMVLSLSLPHLANSMASSLMSIVKRQQLAFDEGVLKGYLSVPSSRQFFEKNATQYEMLSEGVQVLSNFENIQQMGIISDNLTSFEFAMSAKPVIGFPLWATKKSPEFSQNTEIAPSADIAMISYNPDLPDGRSGVGHIMLEKINSTFSLCLQTENWDVYLKKEMDQSVCAETITR